MTVAPFLVRAARTRDVEPIQSLVAPLVDARILLGKDLAVLYGSVQEFRVAVDSTDRVIGCGALHVLWQELGEVRTLAVDDGWRGRRVGHAMLERIEAEAADLGLERLFCLTFEVGFFRAHGYEPMGAAALEPDVIAELARSGDEGVAEFLDLARVRPNTLGNTRMLKVL